jgi:hypothetical protein
MMTSGDRLVDLDQMFRCRAVDLDLDVGVVVDLVLDGVLNGVPTWETLMSKVGSRFRSPSTTRSTSTGHLNAHGGRAETFTTGC